MGTCSSNRQLVVVRQSSCLKLGGKAAATMGAIHGGTDAKNNDSNNNNAMMSKMHHAHHQQSNATNVDEYDLYDHNIIVHQQQQKQQQYHEGNEAKLLKQDSDLNLLPPELQRTMTVLSDESIFEREKRMVVLLVSSQRHKPSQLAVLDVDFQSPGFSRVIRRLNLPLPGEELYSLGCMRNTHTTLPDLDYMTEECSSFTLIAPVPSHSRIYILKLMEASIPSNGGTTLAKRLDNAAAHAAEVANGATKNGGRATEIRMQKCITREELSRWDLGDLFRLDRRTFCPIDRRRRSHTEEEKISSPNSPNNSLSSTPTIRSRSTISTGIGISSTIFTPPTRFPHFGGAMAVHLRHVLAFTTEWGDMDKIMSQTPTLKAQPKLRLSIDNSEMLESDDECDENYGGIYGNKVNVWDMRRRTLVQTIKLEPREDGRWPICIRMVHQTELTHGFICTALGSSIYHLHKSTKTGLFSADRVVKFSSVFVGEWPGDVPEVPAFLTDMAISMDDQHLYVCAAFHGFVAQLSISDPFRPNLTQKVFLGGIVYRNMGIMHGGKTPLGKDSALRSYNTERRFFMGLPFEGGPARLQLSLDGRRLFVSNGFLCNWDEHFFPQMAEHGSMIVLVHIDPAGTKPMKLDANIGIHFETGGDEEEATAADQQQQRRAADKNGGGSAATAAQPQQQHFYAREMRFLNGDSTADHL